MYPWLENEPPLYRDLLKAKMQNPNANVWELKKITRISLKSLTAQYKATMDSPTMDFYQELLDLYPNSLVILTVRDTDEQWWRSWYNTLGAYYRPTYSARLRQVLLWMDWENTARNQMISSYTHLWRSKYGKYGPDVHRQHNLEVINYVPGDRLLVFNIKEGWDPLCKFLGVEVPAEPFPWWYVTKSTQTGWRPALLPAHILHIDGMLICVQEYIKFIQEKALEVGHSKVR